MRDQLVLLTAMLVLLCVSVTPHPELAEDVFSYDPKAWNGPEHWGDVRKDWETCKIGCMQSPISIDDKNVTLALQPEELRWSYVPRNAVMKNIGHGIMIEWEDAVGAVSINGTEYHLKQLHWHVPSENTINGHRFSLEAHLLHQNVINQKMAMVSIVFKVGKPDPFFAKVEKHICTISRKVNASVSLGCVDPAEIIREFTRYYRFQGSITVPPCTEGVTWTVNREVRTISMEQLEMLKGAVMPEYAMNARPLQHINDRMIQLFA